MTEPELLDRLAEACGIGREYHDNWKRVRRTSPDTQRALLRAMGVAVEDEAALRAELRSREARAWCRLLEPVQVVREPYDAIHVRLNVAADRLDVPRVAVLNLERGDRLTQAFVPRDLPVDESREVDGRSWVRCVLRLEADPGLGYHDLTLAQDEAGAGAGTDPARLRLIVAPRRCHEPQALHDGGRVWGPAIQLYALRSVRNWGIGDFGDLDRLARALAGSGAGIVGLNPLHALFPANPAHASPYSPSSRLFFNTMYVEVAGLPDFVECDEARQRVEQAQFQARLAALRSRDLVDYPGVSTAKREVLEICHAHFCRVHLSCSSARGAAFRAFLAERGESLEAYGRFEALAERFHDPLAGVWGWPVWPEPYRRSDSPAVLRFAVEHRDRVLFHQWLQWQVELQLARVPRSSEHGLAVGLYQDLAVSVDRAAFEVWRRPEVYASGASYGAPPDDFAPQGQDWGLPPWIPERLREAGYAPFVEVLRANMRHAGALRVDHVMGLMRAYWVPPGGSATEGAYVHYPFEDLLGVLALESRRNRCLVIGEDLGTVPDEVRAALAPAGVLSCRLLYFARDAQDQFIPPSDYPALALVAPTTHDLPTLAGFWSGRDIALRAELGLFPEERPHAAQVTARGEDRARLLGALGREGLLPEGFALEAATDPSAMSPPLVQAIHRFLARSPSQVLVFQLEDVLEMVDQVNLPGTTEEHPNWCRRLPVALESLLVDPRLLALIEALRRERGP